MKRRKQAAKRRRTSQSTRGVIHDPKSLVIAFAITGAMLLMGMGFIAWAVEGMAAL